MIKTEVEFDECFVMVNNYKIFIQQNYDNILYEVYKEGKLVKEFEASLEQAIKYCLEN